MKTLSEAIQTLEKYNLPHGNWIDHTVSFQVKAYQYTLNIEISRKDDCFHDQNGVVLKEISPIQYTVYNAIQILNWIQQFGLVPAVTIVTEEWNRKKKLRCEFSSMSQIDIAIRLLNSSNFVKVIKHKK